MLRIVSSAGAPVRRWSSAAQEKRKVKENENIADAPIVQDDDGLVRGGERLIASTKVKYERNSPGRRVVVKNSLKERSQHHHLSFSKN
jgi:hypothetical protein